MESSEPNSICISKESKDFEHKYLRAEIESNKKLIFERALLIAGAAFAANLVPKNTIGVELLGPPSMLALAFNLWFTVNRLKSNARIIAYIQLFHESSKKLTWIGWENAIRLYRHWNIVCPKKMEEAKMKFDDIIEYDNLTFYKPIFLLHIALVFSIAVLMSFRAWYVEPSLAFTGEYYLLTIFVINGIGAFIFICWVMWFYQPAKLRYGIEKNRILWASVFSSFEDGQLK